MASTSEVRAWWKAYECKPSMYVRHDFPGPNGKTWSLYVATPSKPVWVAVSQIMASEPYLFRESAGGTYNCRDIAGSTAKSIHAYALAIDINPSKNPHKVPLTTDMPASFIKRMEGIKANGKQALVWGGRWSKPDAMHFQINVAPADCKNVTWDKGDNPLATLDADDLANIEKIFVKVLGGPVTSWTPAGEKTKRSGNQGIINAVHWVNENGRRFGVTIEETHDAAQAAAAGGGSGLVAHDHPTPAAKTGPAKAT